MPVTPVRHTRTLRARTTLTLSACLILLATAMPALASPRTKTCTRINGCATAVSSPPPLPMAFPGAPTDQPSSQLGVAVATSPTSTAKARGHSGMLVADADRGRRIRCGGYRLKAPTTFQFKLQDATASATSAAFRVRITITYEITDRITNATGDGIHFCLGADFAFKTLSGRPAPARRLPDGTRGHVGLLPPCPTPLPPPGATTAPCVEPVTTVKDTDSTTGSDVILKARIPTTVGFATVRGAGDLVGGDPWGGG